MRDINKLVKEGKSVPEYYQLTAREIIETINNSEELFDVITNVFYVGVALGRRFERNKRRR